MTTAKFFLSERAQLIITQFETIFSFLKILFCVLEILYHICNGIYICRCVHVAKFISIMWDVMYRYMCMAYTCVQREMIHFCGEARRKVLI